MAKQTHDQAVGERRAPILATAALLGLASAAQPSSAAAQSNYPIVQVICQVNGGVAQTVRVTYPATQTKNVHIFTPVGGGTDVVIYPPAISQVYSLVVPAGRYRMKFGAASIWGGLGPVMTSYKSMIVIPPFKVVGQMCERSQSVGTPSS